MDKQVILMVWSDGTIERMVSIPARTQLEIAEKLTQEVKNAVLPANIETKSPPISKQDGRPVYEYDKENP